MTPTNCDLDLAQNGRDVQLNKGNATITKGDYSGFRCQIWRTKPVATWGDDMEV